MRLSDFIVDRTDDILAGWIDFIRRTVPAAQAVGDAALLSDPQSILTAVARAVEGGNAQALETLSQAASLHAANRADQGFTLDQMSAEFRAVRSDIIRRWTGELREFGRRTHDEQIRFNDVLDQASAGAASHYAAHLERGRDLFLGVLGHDLRTPLAAISHSASLLRRAGTTSEQRAEAVERIVKSAGRMGLMIQELLDFTRSRLGTQLPMNPVTCDLEDIAKQVLDELSALNPGIVLAIKTRGDLSGRWDSDRVMQLLSNLLDNAIRHHTGDGPVTVQLRGEMDHVSIAVHNVGRPIPAAEQKAIFDPLRRGIDPGERQPPSSGSAGLGLGLYIARQIAVAHGGDVRLESTTEQGTSFVATLARRASASPGDGRGVDATEGHP